MYYLLQAVNKITRCRCVCLCVKYSEPVLAHRYCMLNVTECDQLQSRIALQDTHCKVPAMPGNIAGYHSPKMFSVPSTYPFEYLQFIQNLTPLEILISGTRKCYAETHKINNMAVPNSPSFLAKHLLGEGCVARRCLTYTIHLSV
jgi:hypothetical protein